jgi:chitodextrinase
MRGGMKRAAIGILFVILLLSVAGCSGGSGGSNSPVRATGKTTVSINIGQTRTVSGKGGIIKAASSIPESVADIRITISAPDMLMIERTIAVSGSGGISESFDVPNGINRLFSVEALDKDDHMLYRGAAYADLDGRALSLGITMVSADPLPPSFEGVSGISQITETSLLLSWPAAADEVTPPEKIQYLIYTATSPGGENFDTPTFTTGPGETSFTIGGLNPNTKYYFVVRAMDEGGNIGINNVELSATTLTPSDVSPPDFEGLASATASSSSAAVLGWNAATDNISPPSKIVYLVYIATTPGGQNLASPNFMTTGSTTFSVEGLASGATYYFVVRARDEAGNTDSNVVERSVKIPLPPDTVPPKFGGLAFARAGSSTTAVLVWRDATDDVTSPGNIVYLVYRATNPGGENFGSPSYITTRGTTSFTAGGLSPNTTYYFVVRSRDEAGNIDANTKEMSVTTPSAADVAPPTFGGLVSATLISPSPGGIGLSWNAATDNVTPSANVVYLVYMATTPGGENLAAPYFVTAAGATSVSLPPPCIISPCMPNPFVPGTYYFVVRARDAAGNIDGNTVERSVVVPDVTPPAFAGITLSSISVTSTTFTLPWAPATDNVTSSANMVYQIYQASTPCGENFTTPSYTTAPGATSFTVTGLNTSSTDYYFVVRARDAAGNTDTNTVEASNCTVNFYPQSAVYNSLNGNIDYVICGNGSCGVPNLQVYIQYSDFCFLNCLPATVVGPGRRTGACSISASPVCFTYSVPAGFAPIAIRIFVDPTNAVVNEFNNADNCYTSDPSLPCTSPPPTTCP